VEKIFWQKKWDSLEIGFHQEYVSPLLEAHFDKILETKRKNDTCLVPLCGKTNDLLFLKNHFTEITGVEIIKAAVESFFIENNLQPKVENNTYSYENLEIINDDFIKYPNSTIRKFDFIFDRASMIALPENLRIKYTDSVKKLLSEHSKIFLITIEYDSPKEIGPPFSIKETEVYSHYEDLNIEKIFEQNLGELSPKFKGIQVTQKAFIIDNY